MRRKASQHEAFSFTILVAWGGPLGREPARSSASRLSCCFFLIF